VDGKKRKEKNTGIEQYTCHDENLRINLLRTGDGWHSMGVED
jgi:hypothetical protein